MSKSKTHTGGRFQLDVAGHNVGYLRNFSGPGSSVPPSPGPVSWDLGAPLLPFAGTAAFAAAMRHSQPAGVHGILIGLSPVPLQQPVSGKEGTTGVLVGLLLPAVQRLLDPASSELLLLAEALRPGGWIGVRLADGGLLPLGKGTASVFPACLGA